MVIENRGPVGGGRDVEQDLAVKPAGGQTALFFELAGFSFAEWTSAAENQADVDGDGVLEVEVTAEGSDISFEVVIDPRLELVGPGFSDVINGQTDWLVHRGAFV